MRSIRLFVVFMVLNLGFLSACSQDDDSSPSLLERDLSGTWLSTQETRYYNKETGDYLFSEFFDITIVLADQGSTVQTSSCYDYGINLPVPGVKTASRFYMYVNQNGYSQTPNGDLVRETAVEDDPYSATLQQQKVTTLSQLSPDVLLDNGSLSVSGIIQANEADQVCVLHIYNNLNDNESYDIIIPYDDDILSLRISTSSRLAPGAYNFDRDTAQNEIYRFNFSSSSTIFWDMFSSNVIQPSTATVNISSAGSNSYTGDFAFTDNGNSYSGNFEISPIF